MGCKHSLLKLSMLKLISGFILLFNVLMAMIVTIVCSIPIIMAGLIKIICPLPAISRSMSLFANAMMSCWCEGLSRLLRLNRHLKWDIQGLDGLTTRGWYLLICNHRSWADIVILCVLFRKQIPMTKYFLKQQLAWVPFVGLACWALDMPFMKRYSRAYLLRHPERRGKDIETTRRACLKFRTRPTTIVNFVEGSRFNENKRDRSHSPYRYLLPPKAAGIAMALSVLGEQYDKLLNVTLLYPNNREQPFLDMLSGKMTKVVVRVTLQPISNRLRGDYLNDKQFKRDFQQWLNALWLEKDRSIAQLYAEEAHKDLRTLKENNQ